MNKKKLAQLLRSKIWIGCLVMAAFALWATVEKQYALAIAEVAAALILLVLFQVDAARRYKALIKFLASVTRDVESAAKDTMLNSPLPMVIFRPESDEVIWSNSRFLRLTGEKEHMFDVRLSAVVPGFSSRWLLEGKLECPDLLRVCGRTYQVLGHLVPGEDDRGPLATIYWIDVTDYVDLQAIHQATRPVVALLLLDNYDEVLKNVAESTRSSIVGEISQKLGQLAEETQGLFAQLDRDRYLLIFEERHLERLQETKFPILDAVHNIHNPDATPVTLSIGIGRDADSFQELYQYASLSVEMALSRGGDQAVVKNRVSFEFYGGRAKELEKRTKVKSRVMANALGELVADASSVLIMGHCSADLDCVGAAAGVFSIARKRGVPAYILKEENPAPAEDMLERLAGQQEYQGKFLSPSDAIVLADANTLLVVVDTNRPEQVQSQDLLLSCNKVAVIDHHRRAATYIANAALNYHEPYASSACELVAELLQYLLEPADLLRTEAEALLAGIILDTKHFTMRTGGRTFEAAAFLRRAGADPGELRPYFQSDLEGTVARYDIIQRARLFRESIAIAPVDHTVGRITAAKAADELLNISGIQASFVLYPEGERVVISARSVGAVNVQLILEKLGGGGNAAAAGAQIPGSLKEITQRLMQSIDLYLAEE
ncbi:MAG: DHH family phosphoesterase [Oscillospiraceae bacterium]|nr:DHH family phosphoesterase [Oscillospiraceae bacterium]